MAYGVPPYKARSRHLMDMFWDPGNHGDWKDPGAKDTYYDAASCPGTECQQPVGYWPLVGFAFIHAGNGREAVIGAQSIHDYAVRTKRARPFSVGWAGMLVSVAASMVRSKVEVSASAPMSAASIGNSRASARSTTSVIGRPLFSICVR